MAFDASLQPLSSSSCYSASAISSSSFSISTSAALSINLAHTSNLVDLPPLLPEVDCITQSLISFQPSRIGLDLKKLVVCLLLAGVLSISANVERSFANADNEPAPAPASPQAAESYVLPITPPLHQGDTGLCWMFATLSMLETNYLVRHPGSQISLSRGAMQVEAVEDRLERLVRGEFTSLSEGGLAVEALALIRKDGMVAQPDFRDIVDSNRIAQSIEEDLARIPDRVAKEKTLSEEAHIKLGVVPEVTHLDGQVVSADQMARAVTDGYEWTEFDLSPTAPRPRVLSRSGCAS